MLLAAWAIAPFILTAVDAASHHLDFFGVAGYYPMDGDQYLSWILSAQHGLIRSLYGTTAAGAVFLHPMFSLSGLFARFLGTGPVLVMAFWKGVSIVVLFAGCARLVVRHVPAGRAVARTVAMLIALFGGLTPLVFLLGTSDPVAPQDLARVAGDLVAAMSTWDYSPLAIAVGLMPFAIEGVEHILSGRATRRRVTVTAVLGLLIAWLHPWQGETLLVVTGALILGRVLDHRFEQRRSQLSARERAVGIGVFAIGTGIPILYYLILSHLDAGWAISESNSVSAAQIPGPVLDFCVLPLSFLGLLLAYRARNDRGARTLVAWSTATLLVVVITPSGQYHAIDGMMLPLGALIGRQLAVAGPRRRSIAAGALVLALGPFAIFAGQALPHMLTPQVTAYTEIPPSEVTAAHLAAKLAHGRPILTTPALGTVLPGLDDAVTWVGHPIWTPNYLPRYIDAFQALRGYMSPAKTLRFVTRTSNVVIEPCGAHGHLQLLPGAGYRVYRSGCATVYARPASS